MTDEQVDRIVQALQGSGDWWTPLILTGIGAILGFLLSQLQEWFSRRRKRADEAVAARKAVVQEAITHTAYVSGLQSTDIVINRKELYDRQTAIAGNLFTFSVPLATWFNARTKLLRDNVALQKPTNADRALRAQIGTKTVTTLQQWARGEVKESVFADAVEEIKKRKKAQPEQA